MSDPALAGRRILVTGATGFVGSELVRTLVARGARVRACTRGRAPAGLAGAEWVETGDIAQRGDWSEILAGMDAVVHAAARVHVGVQGNVDERAYQATNVAATERLARQAAAARVSRFVFLSSIKVNGERTVDRPFTAQDPPAPADPYARSKLAAERALADVAASTGLQVATVRPPLVYGPGAGANFARLARLVASGIPLPFGAVDNRRSLVSVWNLADLVATLLVHPAAPGGVWLAADGEDLSTAELVRRLARASGSVARLLPVPPAMLRLAGRLAGRSAEVSRLLESLCIDIRPTCELLGWRPPLTVDAGIARTMASFARGRRGAS